MLKKILKISFFILILLAAAAVFLSDKIQAASSPDAIAIRVMPNSNHTSPLVWYKKNIKLQGSPQNLLVDGYEAVRDGRTVYVNAANISPNSSGVDDFFTNIYIISYNQTTDNTTLDIFGQILAHWKFNANITGSGNCSKTTSQACLYSSQCPLTEYCLSQKAKIIRDTKRLADLAEIKSVLENYKKNGFYPKLSAGSYLANKTVSTWPSWSQTLGKDLGATLPVDPINKLGICGVSYDPITCWDQANKTFAGTIPNNLPSGSLVYVYNAATDGLSYGLCASNVESGYANIVNLSACNVSTNNASTATIAVDAPKFTGSNLPQANSGKKYENAYIQADREGLTWTIAKAPNSCDMWDNLRLVNTTNNKQKAVKADKAGVGGDCVVALTISAKGKSTTQNFTINTINKNLPVIQAVSDKEIVISKDLDFTVVASEADGQYPLTFRVTSGSLPAGLTGTVVNDHNYQISGTVTAVVGDYSIGLTAYDSYEGASSQINFTIKVINHPPVITAISDKEVIIGRSLNFTIQASDSDGSLHYPLTFNITGGSPSGLTQALAGNQHDLVIGGMLVDQTKDYNLSVTATDAFGAISAVENFKITITNNPPDLPALLDEAIGCKDYSFSFPETDNPDGHDITYTASGLPSGLSLSDNKIIGKPTIAAGGYNNITINAKDQYSSQTISPYSAEDNNTYTLTVNNESFTLDVTPDGTITNNTIYVYPELIENLYHPLTHYDADLSVTPNNTSDVTYSFVNQPPGWLTIKTNTDKKTGKIFGTPTNNTTDPGNHTVTVQATNDCGATATKEITIHVLKNEWCGDNILNGGEQCDHNDFGGKTNVNFGFTGILSCNSSCQAYCSPNSCAGRSCGTDGCGGSCGTAGGGCASGYSCGSDEKCCKDNYGRCPSGYHAEWTTSSAHCCCPGGAHIYPCGGCWNSSYETCHTGTGWGGCASIGSYYINTTCY